MGTKTIACVVARTVSTRLPLKVLRAVTPTDGMLAFIIERAKRIKKVQGVILCTSTEPVDDILEDVAALSGVPIYRGSADEVIERLLSAGERYGADHVIRVTGDNVFNAWEFVDDLIAVHEQHSLDYSRITGLPFGATPEIMSLAGLRRCAASIDPKLSEYLTIFMFLPELYRCGVLRIASLPDLSEFTLTVDTPNDLQRTRMVFEHFTGKDPRDIVTADIIRIINDQRIPFAKVNPQVFVKLPNDVTVPFAEFLGDLRRRASASLQFEVN